MRKPLVDPTKDDRGGALWNSSDLEKAAITENRSVLARLARTILTAEEAPKVQCPAFIRESR